MRVIPEKLSISDENQIDLTIRNHYPFEIMIEIIDEIPFQFQKRDFSIKETLLPFQEKHIPYTLTPLERGEFIFGHTNIYARSFLNLVTRRFTLNQEHLVKTYPAFLKLKKFDLKTINHLNSSYGLKKVRRIGNSFEFEQIKDYVQGDNIRNLNWKATAKKNQLMINQFTDEKSQQIYLIIDKGRTMKMPFQGLSLLDYAINSALVLSHIILQKQDKAGLFSFSKTVENFIVSQRRNNQLSLILEALYNIETKHLESNYGLLYNAIKQQVKQRSLLILFTNFDSMDALHRQLNYLKAINKSHLLLIVFFKNTEILAISQKNTKTDFEMIRKTISEKFIYDQEQMVLELRKHGIYSILTTPENLTVDTINKYIEIKTRGLI